MTLLKVGVQVHAKFTQGFLRRCDSPRLPLQNCTVKLMIFKMRFGKIHLTIYFWGGTLSGFRNWNRHWGSISRIGGVFGTLPFNVSGNLDFGAGELLLPHSCFYLIICTRNQRSRFPGGQIRNSRTDFWGLKVGSWYVQAGLQKVIGTPTVEKK